jgi:hypothetical protein
MPSRTEAHANSGRSQASLACAGEGSAPLQHQDTAQPLPLGADERSEKCRTMLSPNVILSAARGSCATEGKSKDPDDADHLPRRFREFYRGRVHADARQTGSHNARFSWFWKSILLKQLPIKKPSLPHDMPSRTEAHANSERFR